MASAGSAYTFRVPNSTVENGTATSSCVPCGFERKRHGNTLTGSVLGCRLPRCRVRKILRMYQHTALQPLVQTVWPSKRRSKRSQIRMSSAPPEEGVTVHGMSSTAQVEDSWEEARKMLDASLDNVATDANLEQGLHESARMFQLALEKRRSLTKGPWFAKAWLGIDHNAWLKSIAYQAAVHALIQAALNIMGRREGKGLFVCTVVQQSLLHLCKPLEDSIHQHLSSRDPAAEDWLWCNQHAVAVGHFTRKLEIDLRFTGLTALDRQESHQFSNKELDAMLLTVALSICATVMKLGSGKLSCPPLSLELAKESGRLMDAFVDCASIDHVYHFTSSIGLKSQFLSHFGSRAALDKGDSDLDEAERVFWIELVQRSLRAAFAQEGFHSKLSSFTNIEVLVQDLAVFGFFAALGLRARSFLTRRKDLDDCLLSLFRYMEGGCVLFYPQLATLTTYQLFVEVVSEELSWIPFFEENSGSLPTPGKMIKEKGDLEQFISQEEEGEALATVLNVCSYWVDDFMMYSNWIQRAKSPETIKFLSNIQSRLCDCIAATSQGYQQSGSNKAMMSRAAMEVEQSLKRLAVGEFSYKELGENSKLSRLYQRWDSQRTEDQLWSRQGERDFVNLLHLEEQLKSFDKDLQTVEEVLFKLEGLLKKSDLSRFQNWKVHLAAIKINLRKIRRLKREAEALEVSLKHKASLNEKFVVQTKLQQGYGDEENQRCMSSSIIPECFEGTSGNVESSLWQERSRASILFELTINGAQEWTKKLPFFSSSGKGVLRMGAPSTEEDDAFDMAAAAALDEAGAVSNEACQFEHLRLELVKLESRIRDCTGEPSVESVSTRMLPKKEESAPERGKVWEFLSKSTEDFKNASLDVLKGTQLLGMDVSVAVALLGHSISGHDLTEREKKILRRTCTDLASVIPIGFLMLLPVTAVGHAAMLAAIQKYIPALIPSAYGSERLDLLKQLEKLKEMDVDTAALDVTTLHVSEGGKVLGIRGRTKE